MYPQVLNSRFFQQDLDMSPNSPSLCCNFQTIQQISKRAVRFVDNQEELYLSDCFMTLYFLTSFPTHDWMVGKRTLQV